MYINLVILIYFSLTCFKQDDDDDNKFISNPENKKVEYIPSYFIVTVKSGLIVRQNFNHKSAEIGILPFKHIGKVEKKTIKEDLINNIKAPWLKIRYNGMYGWIFSGYTKWGHWNWIKQNEIFLDFSSYNLPKNFFLTWEKGSKLKLKPLNNLFK